ncbi:hypothetical protein [Campylobacter sputorum]|uniref:hypothetical protein n=1 Tax=Campylobacter sputorum TaxID=206 RepID=UPI001E412390|nr:hypothetical protein [Campylobacter sputorum]
MEKYNTYARNTIYKKLITNIIFDAIFQNLTFMIRDLSLLGQRVKEKQLKLKERF